MPTYTFACKQCDERLDVVLSFSDDPLTVCPACEGELRQVFKPAGIVFKGEGWHIKDYADKAAVPAGDGASTGSSSGDSGRSSSESSTSAGTAGTASSTTSSSTSGSTSSSTSSD